jgi:transcriptional regulator with XRE-family HTH domain
MGTTQSAIARLESGRGKGSPSPATLRNCARALGYRLEFRLASDHATARR